VVFFQGTDDLTKQDALAKVGAISQRRRFLRNAMPAPVFK
jgi:hypothetical protein